MKFTIQSVCIYLSVCAHVYVYMHGSAYEDQRTTSSIIPQKPSTLFWFWFVNRISHWPGAHQLGQGAPNPPGSASLALVSQVPAT